MFLNEEFIKIYEELSELNESKADTQRLIDFAGEDLANRFLAIKNKLKAPENDLYYWIKNKTVDEFAARLQEIETSKSKTQLRKESVNGAKLIKETEHWKIYSITTFEASRYYGRDTRWCITGINGWGDKYWNEYINKGISFYFLITKGEYNPRGLDSKIALAIYPDKKHYEVFNQQDVPILFSSIPYAEEIEIPGVDFYALAKGLHCYDCDELLTDETMYLGLHGEVYCEECFKEHYFKCAKCGGIFYKSYVIEDAEGNMYCRSCESISQADSGFQYILEIPGFKIHGVARSAFQTVLRLADYLDQVPTADRENSTLVILSQWTGEIIYPSMDAKNDFLIGTEREILKAVSEALKKYEEEL